MRLFVDMDGTMNIFRAIQDPSEMYEKGFFKTAVQHPGVVEAIRWLVLNTDIEVYSLSACPIGSAYAKAEKDEWLDLFLPELTRDKRIYTLCGESKAEAVSWLLHEDGEPVVISHGDVLLDDYSVNLHDWEAAGGTGIKFLNGINGNYGTWTGKTVTMHNTLSQLQLLGIGKKKCFGKER